MFRSLVSFLLVWLIYSLAACQKAKEPKRYVKYLVSIRSGNTVSVFCANDYYFDSKGQAKEITYKADFDYFVSTRLAEKNEPYFLIVKPKLLIHDTVNVSAVVTINDSIVNFKSRETFDSEIVLFGFVN